MTADAVLVAAYEWREALRRCDGSSVAKAEELRDAVDAWVRESDEGRKS